MAVERPPLADLAAAAAVEGGKRVGEGWGGGREVPGEEGGEGGGDGDDPGDDKGDDQEAEKSERDHARRAAVQKLHQEQGLLPVRFYEFMRELPTGEEFGARDGGLLYRLEADEVALVAVDDLLKPSHFITPAYRRREHADGEIVAPHGGTNYVKCSAKEVAEVTAAATDREHTFRYIVPKALYQDAVKWSQTYPF